MTSTLSNGMVRHLPTIITAVSLALLFWVFTSVQDLSVSVARQTEQINGLRGQLVALNSGRDRRIDAIEARVERLESRK